MVLLSSSYKIATKKHKMTNKTKTICKSKMALVKAPLVEVVWMDAASHSRVSKIALGNLSELLVESHTFGKIVAENGKVVVVATHMNNSDGLDFIAIPKGWIKIINNSGGPK